MTFSLILTITDNTLELRYLNDTKLTFPTVSSTKLSCHSSVAVSIDFSLPLNWTQLLLLLLLYFLCTENSVRCWNDLLNCDFVHYKFLRFVGPLFCFSRERKPARNTDRRIDECPAAAGTNTVAVLQLLPLPLACDPAPLSTRVGVALSLNRN